jgi:hypothetical protein
VTTQLDRCAAAPPSWTVRGLRFERNRQPIRRFHRWGCSDGAYGVANCRTPLGAFIAQRRWRRKAMTLGPDGTP